LAVNKNKLIANAQKFVQKGQHEKAIREYNKILDADPREERIRLKVAELYARVGKVSEAIDSYLYVANSYSKQGFYLKAVAVFKQILKVDPDYLDGTLRLAELYQQLGLVSDAMLQFQRLVEHYEQAGQVEQALGVLEQMSALDPDNFQSRLRYAQALVRAERGEEAIEEYERIAAELRGTDQLDDYIRVLELLCQARPEDHSRARELSNIYIKRGEIKRALTKLQVCFQENPQDSETLLLLVEAFRSLNQDAKVLSVYRELVKVYEAEGRIADRDEIYQKILELDPDDPEARGALEGGALPSPAASSTEEYSAMPFEVAEPLTAEPLPAEPAPVETESDIIDLDASDVVEISEPHKGGAPQQVLDPATAKRLTEADVYIKYGLLDRAKSHLLGALQEQPSSMPVREKLVEVFKTAGETDEAVEQLAALVDLAERQGQADRAAAFAIQAKEIAPNNPTAGALSGRYDDGGAGGGGLADLDGDAEEFSLGGEDDFADLGGADLTDSNDDGALLSDDELFAAPTELSADDDFSDGLVGLDGGAEEFELGLDDGNAPIALGVDDAAGGAADDDFSLDSDAERDFFLGDEPEDVGSAEKDPGFELSGDGQADGAKPSGPEIEMDLLELSETSGAFGIDPDSFMLDESAVAPVPASDPGPAEEEEPEDEFADDIEEARFFIEQRLLDDAQGLLEEILEQKPDHEQARALLQQVTGSADADGAAAGAVNSPNNPSGNPSGSMDSIARELAEEFEDDGDDVTQTRATEELVREDHFDVGAAYHGMGMYDEAIREFEIAARASDDREADCRRMIGVCLHAKGDLRGAKRSFKQGLNAPGITDTQKLELYYELGCALEGEGKGKEAKKCFTWVYKRNKTHRDVVERLRRLQ